MILNKGEIEVLVRALEVLKERWEGMFRVEMGDIILGGMVIV